MTCDVNMGVQPISGREAEPWLLKKHYAKRVPSIAYAFGLYIGNQLRGVVTYGIPANSNLNTVAGYPGLELNRLCVDDGAPRNSSSTLVGRSLRLVPSPTCIVSYADCDQGHVGYIYQATNWLYTGMGAGDVEFEKDGRRFHRKALFNIFGTGSRSVLEESGYRPTPVAAKHRYVFFVGNKRQKRDMRDALGWPVLPYPKGATVRYDAGSEVSAQPVLFMAPDNQRRERKPVIAKTPKMAANDNSTPDMFANAA